MERLEQETDETIQAGQEDMTKTPQRTMDDADIDKNNDGKKQSRTEIEEKGEKKDEEIRRMNEWKC